MLLRLLLLSVVTGCTVFSFNAAGAGEVDSSSAASVAQPSGDQLEEDATETKTAEENDGPAAKMQEAIKTLSEKMKPEEMQHFASVYNNYNMVSTVKTVRKDVSEAINACGETNADMKQKMDSRFANWIEAVDPVITEAEANINNMILAQDYAKKEEVQNIFNMVDETRSYTAERHPKVPVTTPEACGFLLGKMDETQSAMLSLLRAGMASYPQSTAMPKEKQ